MTLQLNDLKLLVAAFLFYFSIDIMAGTSLTFLQNYTVPLFSLGETNVCPLGISQRFWQQAVDEEKWKFQESHKRQTGAGCTEIHPWLRL